MAKLYRTVQLKYNATTLELDVRTDRETVPITEFSTVKRAIDGTLYRQYTTTNTKRVFNYQYNRCDEDIYNFFNDAHLAQKAGSAITMVRELDDATTEEFSVSIDQPQYTDDTIGTTGKAYNNLRVTIREV